MCCSKMYPALLSPALRKHYQAKSHITQSLNAQGRETMWLILNSPTCIACWLCWFSPLLCFFHPAPSVTASSTLQGISAPVRAQWYLRWLIMPAHLSCQQIRAGHFPEGKMRRRFSQLELPSHLKPIQQHSSCLTLRGFSWQRWFCLVVSHMLLSKASGCFWGMALLDPKFSASMVSTRRTACPQHLSNQRFFLYS